MLTLIITIASLIIWFFSSSPFIISKINRIFCKVLMFSQKKLINGFKQKPLFFPGFVEHKLLDQPLPIGTNSDSSDYQTDIYGHNISEIEDFLLPKDKNNDLNNA